MNMNLRKLRKTSGVTQGELADALKVDIKTVGNWERGKSYPNAAQLWDIAIIIGYSPNEILGWKEECAAFENTSERELIDCYRTCTPSRQDRILDTARDAAEMSKEATENYLFESSQISA